MCTSFYLGALAAFIAMGKFLEKDVNRYEHLFAKGKKYLENQLFNGEYFFQEIKYTGLKAGNPVEASKISMGGEYSEKQKKY